MKENHLSPVWTHLTTIQPQKARGALIYDSDGNTHLDFTCGIGVTNTGHCHPKVVDAIKKQADQLLFGQINIVTSKPAIELAERLNKITPASIDQFFFSNSGAEAVEGAIKLAKFATGKSNVIVFQGSFHGRTHLAMSMTTSKTSYRGKYQPMVPGIHVAPFPYPFFYGWDEKTTTQWCIKQLNHILKSQTSPDETAAIIIEPLLGEGGYVPAPVAFLKELRDICTQNNMLFIVDEVQSGFGRTGKMFCIDHAEIEPDIMVMAKGMGSGLPISALGASKLLMEKWAAGVHGGTYGGGSAIPLAAANATIQVLEDEKIPENAAIMGEILLGKLNELKSKFSCIGENRGLGLMIGTELVDAQGNPDPKLASEIQSFCVKKRLLILTCGTNLNVIRWIPPLIVTEIELNLALEIFNEALESATS